MTRSHKDEKEPKEATAESMILSNPDSFFDASDEAAKPTPETPALEDLGPKPSVGDAVDYHYDDRDQRVAKRAVVSRVHDANTVDLKFVFLGNEVERTRVPRARDVGAIGEPATWSATRT